MPPPHISRGGLVSLFPLKDRLQQLLLNHTSILTLERGCHDPCQKLQIEDDDIANQLAGRSVGRLVGRPANFCLIAPHSPRVTLIPI